MPILDKHKLNSEERTTINHQPTTINHQPSTINHQPSTINHQQLTIKKIMITIYHNPRCSKSREALHLLEEKGETIEIVKYLENTPSQNELKQVIELLRISPIELVRTHENIWKENYKGKNLTPDEIIEAMIAHPKLIERPIVIKGTQAVLGRPPEKVLDIL